MPETLATIAAWLILLYLGVGILFAIPFVQRGAAAIDSAAKKVSITFRVLIFPGSVALWPLLLHGWIKTGGNPPEEKNAHRLACALRPGKEGGSR